MINRDFPNHDVKENVKAGWDFPNHELCHVIIQKQLHLNSNNCTSLKTKVTMVNQGRSAHLILLWLEPKPEKPAFNRLEIKQMILYST